jgi:hypothetical protein
MTQVLLNIYSLFYRGSGTMDGSLQLRINFETMNPFRRMRRSTWTGDQSISKPLPTQVNVKLSLCLTKHHAMKTYWGWRYSYTHSLTSALDGSEWSVSRPGRFTPRERAPGAHWIGGWVGPRAILDTELSRLFNLHRTVQNKKKVGIYVCLGRDSNPVSYDMLSKIIS